MLEPKAGLLPSMCMACLPHCPSREREAQRGQVTCPRSRRGQWQRPGDLRGFPLRTPLPTRSGPSNWQLRVRGRASPCCQSVSPSVCLRGRSGAPLPSLGRCAGRGRAFAAPGSRRTAAPPPAAPQPVLGSRRGQGAAAGWRRDLLLPRSLSALRESPAGKPQRPTLQDEEAPGSSPQQGRARGQGRT